MSKAWTGQGQKGSHGSGERVWARIIPNPKLKLLDQCREEMSQEPKAKIELFLSDLAVNGQVAAATQNQAFNSLLFVYREVLGIAVDGVEAVRADRPVRVPVVMTKDETRRVFLAMSGTTQLVVKLLYGGGLRLLEGLRLQIGRASCRGRG